MKSSYFSNRTFVGSLCCKERKGKLDTSVKNIICWMCVQALRSMPKQKKDELYESLKDKKGLIERFMEEDSDETRRNMARKGFSRTARLKNRQNRKM